MAIDWSTVPEISDADQLRAAKFALNKALLARSYGEGDSSHVNQEIDRLQELIETYERRIAAAASVRRGRRYRTIGQARFGPY